MPTDRLITLSQRARFDFIGNNIYMVHAFVKATDAAPGCQGVAGGGFTPTPFRPYPKKYPRAVQQPVDLSSRYFVIRVQQ